MRALSCLSRIRRMGRRLSAGLMMDTVRVWEAATGAELLKLEGHEALSILSRIRRMGRRLSAGLVILDR